jgi:hypothetical protein
VAAHAALGALGRSDFSDVEVRDAVRSSGHDHYGAWFDALRAFVVDHKPGGGCSRAPRRTVGGSYYERGQTIRGRGRRDICSRRIVLVRRGQRRSSGTAALVVSQPDNLSPQGQFAVDTHEI